MSVTVEKVIVPAGKMPLKGSKPWEFTDQYKASFYCSIDCKKGYIHAIFDKGYKLDFCSAPWPFNKKYPQFLDDPSWDICAGVHDVGFGLKGAVLGLGRSLDAGEMDDILRGGWRCYGMSRFWASSADFWLVFAHTKKHWGADQYNCKYKAKLVWEPEVQK